MSSPLVDGIVTLVRLFNPTLLSTILFREEVKECNNDSDLAHSLQCKLSLDLGSKIKTRKDIGKTWARADGA